MSYGQNPWPPLGSSIGHERAGLLSVTGHVLLTVDTVGLDGCGVPVSLGTAGIGVPGARDVIGSVDDRTCTPPRGEDVLTFLKAGPVIERTTEGMRLRTAEDYIEFTTAPP